MDVEQEVREAALRLARSRSQQFDEVSVALTLSGAEDRHVIQQHDFVRGMARLSEAFDAVSLRFSEAMGQVTSALQQAAALYATVYARLFEPPRPRSRWRKTLDVVARLVTRH